MDKKNRYELALFYLDKDCAYMFCTTWNKEYLQEFLDNEEKKYGLKIIDNEPKINIEINKGSSIAITNLDGILDKKLIIEINNIIDDKSKFINYKIF